MKTSIRAALGAAVLLVAVGVGVGASLLPRDPAPGAADVGTIHVGSAETAEPVTGTIGFDQQVVALLDPTDWHVRFPVPSGATGCWVFVSPRGQESVPAAWNAKSAVDLAPGDVLLPNISLTTQVTAGGGSPNGIQAVRAAGGDYSLGLAFTTDDGRTVVPGGLSYGHVHVSAGSGDWTFSEVLGGTGTDG